MFCNNHEYKRIFIIRSRFVTITVFIIFSKDYLEKNNLIFIKIFVNCIYSMINYST